MLIYLQMIESEEDRSKFEQLYLKYRSLMLRVAMRILHNEQDAEDAVHQAFLSILNNLEKISSVDCLQTKSYIVVIVERKSIDLIRSQKRSSILTTKRRSGSKYRCPVTVRSPTRWQSFLPAIVRRCSFAFSSDTV